MAEHGSAQNQPSNDALCHWRLPDNIQQEGN